MSAEKGGSAGALVLASTSPFRRQLLERLGLEFQCVAPPVDEECLKDGGRAPEEVATVLARAKALAVLDLHPEAIVIGADQVCAMDQTLLSKPGSPERAIEQLASLAGRQHRLLTAVCVACSEEVIEFRNTATLSMRSLTSQEIQRYVDLDEPQQCAGAYKLERAGVSLFEEILCEDHSAITGLPLMELAETLRRLGVQVP